MRTGLRTEIILSISLLLAAALLFAGFLLVKLTERTLLDQQRAHAANIINLLVADVGASLHPGQVVRPSDSISSHAERLQTILNNQAGILAWRLLDHQMQILASSTYRSVGDFSTISPSLIERGELYEELAYESFRFFDREQPLNYLDLSAPIWHENDLYGLLQIRFSLAGLQERVQASQHLVLVYVVIYGVVLAAFGVYLLNRNVVKPVRQLHQATTSVAGGTLAKVAVPSGPGEIHELADSFNQMVEALAESRAETEEHIASLERTNRALEQARDDLVRSEKLATVGHLAAGMAHEIGNPLGAVVGYLNILKDDLSGASHDLVERSLAETARIDRLVRELLEYSAPVDHQSASFCPVNLLRETIDMLRHQGQLDGIEVNDLCTENDCLVDMDHGRLMQVWINLLLNARDAIDDRRELEIASCREGEFIKVSVRDQGHGIEQDALKRIFEPFFTTKSPGSGYGLGLAVCQRIIDESGGTIEVTSNPGEGTCFTVSLPCLTERLS